jgi:hypothetical protein
MNSNTVPRLDVSSLMPQTFYDRYQKNGIPAVITGLLNSKSTWNLEYICQELGTQEFLLRRYGNSRYKEDKRQWKNIGSGVDTTSTPFLEYAEMLRTHEAHKNDIYLAKCSLKNTTLNESEALKIIRDKLPRLGLDKPITDFNIWVGPGGHVECLHYDQMDGTLIQLYGAKKVVLFPPSQTSNLYPFPVYVHLYKGLQLRSWFSQVYPDRPDFKSFPKFNEALKYKQEVILNPGDVLYIPAGWWHEVTALDDDMVCSVNRFWRVYPTKRAIFSWTRLRAYLGSICAIPYVLLSLVIALASPDRKQKLKKIWQMI